MKRCILLFFSILSAVGFCEKIDLEPYEHSVYSQNGEDGVIKRIFEIIGTSSKFYVEFGGYDGYSLSNTRNLREFYGWTGLLLDGDYEDLSIFLYKEFLTAENINEVFAKYKVPYDVDFLSIDIDYNDFHIWNALSERYQPRLVVVEYNATHLPHENKVVKYHPMGKWDGTNYFGASLLAFYQLGRKKGYSLVYIDKKSINLFFVRNDLIGKGFKNQNQVKKLYRHPHYGNGPNGGHPQDPLHRSYVSGAHLLAQ